MENPELNETIEETETDVSEETKSQLEDSTHESSEDEGRKSAIAKISEIFKRKPSAEKLDEGESDEPDADEQSEESEEKSEVDDTALDTEEYEEIDPRFIDAARKYGWSDDRIIQYAETHDDHDIVMLTGMMSGPAQPVEEKAQVKEEESPYSKVLGELETNEAVSSLTKSLLKSLVTDLQTTKEQLKSITSTQKEVEETKVQTEWLGRLQTADEIFDETAKEFPELGAAKTLRRLPDGSLNPNDEAVKSRESLFKMAVVLFESGKDWHGAIRDSLRWYRGGREDVVEAKMLKKIKENSKRVSPKREQRHQVRKFANDIDEKAAVVNEALRKHGIELPE